jgi:hypothetical protein
LNLSDLRQLIRPQADAFRAERFSEPGELFTSDLSGQLAARAVAHVDHVTHFEEIVATFAAVENISIETELLTIAKDATSEPTWKDNELAARFVEFHKLFPLRLITSKENLSRPRWKQNNPFAQ